MKLNLKNILFCLLNLVAIQIIAVDAAEMTKEKALENELQSAYNNTFGGLGKSITIDQLIQEAKKPSWKSQWSNVRKDFEEYLNKYRSEISEELNVGTINQIGAIFGKLDFLEDATESQKEKSLANWKSQLEKVASDITILNAQLNTKIDTLKKSFKGKEHRFAAQLLLALNEKTLDIINKIKGAIR